MKTKFKQFASIAVTTLSIAFLATGCAPMEPDYREIAAADYGPELTREDAMQTAIRYERKRLIDPDSAKFEFGQGPDKHWEQNGKETFYGYILYFTINAKNRYGGYTGKKGYAMFFVRGVPANVHELNDSGTGFYPPLSQFR